MSATIAEMNVHSPDFYDEEEELLAEDDSDTWDDTMEVDLDEKHDDDKKTPPGPPASV